MIEIAIGSPARRATGIAPGRGRRVPARLSIAAVCVLLCGAGLLLGPTLRHGSEEAAFAAVRQAMRRAATLHFRMTQSSSEGFVDPHDNPLAAHPLEVWVRSTPYAIAYREPDGTCRLRTLSGATLYHPATKTVENDANDPAEMKALDLLLAPEARRLKSDTTALWKAQHVVEQGRELICYRSKRTEKLTAPRGESFEVRSELAVWADPQTHLVVHSEVKQTPTLGGKTLGWVKESLDRFRYNDPLPADLFQLRSSPSGAAPHPGT